MQEKNDDSNQVADRKQEHHFINATLKKPTFCDVCKQFIWGLSNQGVICTGCSMITHHKCSTRVPQCSSNKSLEEMTGFDNRLRRRKKKFASKLAVHNEEDDDAVSICSLNSMDSTADSTKTSDSSARVFPLLSKKKSSPTLSSGRNSPSLFKRASVDSSMANKQEVPSSPILPGMNIIKDFIKAKGEASIELEKSPIEMPKLVFLILL